MAKVILDYSKHGWAIADDSAEEFVLRCAEGEEKVVHVSTANVITAARALVCEGRIEAEFRFNDKVIVPDSRGRLKEWPPGFCDHVEKWLMRLLKA